MEILGAVLTLCLAVAFIVWIRSPAVERNPTVPRAHTRVRSYDLRLPDLCSNEAAEEVPSARRDGVTYLVNPGELSCTCQDWQQRASAKGFARCCKHLLSVLHRRGIFANADQWTRAISAHGYGAPHSAWLITLETAPSVLVTAARSREWVDVYAHSKRSGERIADASGPVERFGWSVGEDRWSYGQGPPGARELTPIMKEIL